MMAVAQAEWNVWGDSDTATHWQLRTGSGRIRSHGLSWFEEAKR